MLHDYTTTTPERVTNSTDQAIATATGIVDNLVAAPTRSWETTMAPLDEVAAVVSNAYGLGPFLGQAHPDSDVRDAAVAAEEKLSKFGSDLVFRTDLYEAVQAYAATDDAAALSGTRARLVEHWLRDFRRAGHGLPEEKRSRLQELQNRLIELQVAFARNLAENKDHVDVTRAQLFGTTEDYISRLSPGQDEGTFRVSMDYPDYIPFMERAEDRDMRSRLQHTFWNKAAGENRPLLEEAITIRDEMAAILGAATWAHHVMELKMAKNPEAVDEFYDGIIPGLTKLRDAELEVQRGLLEADHPGETLATWDTTFYNDQQKRTDYGVDATEVAKYFPLEETIRGMFDVTGDVLGLDYRKIEDTKAWHPDVLLYEISDRASGEPIAYFYADLFPREGKFSHAAAFPVVYGRETPDGYVKPVSAILANFTKPTDDGPSLLKHSEALTLWHEFGHILHFCLTEVDLVRFSGYDTEWDFVEAPSQIMEWWMWQPEVLQRFARHYETGEAIPIELVEKMVAARDLNNGMFNMRQVMLGQLDLAMHAVTGEKDLDVINREANNYTGLPFYEGTFFPAGFGHLMGGYDAGYYGYLWSKVYGDDMFSVFQAEGITSPDVGKRYREEVLAMGHARDAIDHLRAFLGREPNGDAFLANLGIG
ncbi:MAG: Zn-dependent oligopeptidase [Acidimicrobiia bacterium]|nr:Zn-dependent oligopeptidase [Acidimicrobiia bacterium]NNC74753.1 Zn-dependent oligopeptidase [Acidimicrobiia bacterium]